MFSDDVLMEQLILKGGNARDVVHGLTARGSVAHRPRMRRI